MNPLNPDSPKPNELCDEDQREYLRDVSTMRAEDDEQHYRHERDRARQARPHAIRKDREILIPAGKVMLVFSTAIEAREYSEVLHATHFVCQTSEPWRYDEADGVLRLPMHGKHRIRVLPNGQRIDLDVKR